MNLGTFDPRHPAESEPLGFGFAARLATGETIVSAVFTIEVVEGVDPSPGDLLAGSPTTTTTGAFQRITGGVDGCTYKLTCVATTSASNIHEVCATFSVVDC